MQWCHGYVDLYISICNNNNNNNAFHLKAPFKALKDTAHNNNSTAKI